MKLLRLSVWAGLFFALSVNRVFAQAEKVFFGNLHSHTSYSDGSGTPDEAYQRAREVAHLDFLAITEHNHAQCEEGASADRKDGIMIATSPNLYTGPDTSALIPAAQRWNTDGQFVALYGQEYSSISKGNHINVFEVGEVIDVPNGEFDQLTNDWLPSHLDSTGQPAIIQFNHPADCRDACPAKEYGRDDFGSQSGWVQHMDQNARLIEIVNGPALQDVAGERGKEMEEKYWQYLTLGFHLAPTADQDNHYKTWGTATDARTAVITDELTKAKVLAALRARHVYATEDKNLRVLMHVNGHLCGDRITPQPAVNSELQIDFAISDDDEPDASYEVQVWSGKVGVEDPQMVEAVPVTGSDPRAGHIQDIKYTGGAQYVFFKIVQSQEDGVPDNAWTAPVWFGSASVTPSPGGGGAAANFVASRNSGVYHLSLQCRDAQSIKPANRITGPTAAQGRRLHQGCPR